MIKIIIHIEGDNIAGITEIEKARVGEIALAVYELEKNKLKLLNLPLKKK